MIIRLFNDQNILGLERRILRQLWEYLNEDLIWSDLKFIIVLWDPEMESAAI
jgi:hypothetical protein